MIDPLIDSSIFHCHLIKVKKCVQIRKIVETFFSVFWPTICLVQHEGGRFIFKILRNYSGVEPTGVTMNTVYVTMFENFIHTCH